ncbi:TPA: acrEF/envCD operon transcriptional regulator [Kluyvera georgiana]|uniref:acrEF/envCD operon transcriptional regulator n=2 Tax=Kluyvera georgiana TaxID=73098 RepID=UPI00230340F8|nr:acrEF/envCD operon transcriptional regulator [Kluyvera georgiana]MDA8492659.1 acrEF/envCD operon transcriptional regulator [Kluyvera georgiana]HDG1689967.1 acrEF/envCD operon transcriptional regulator [Kluyvera georgiana]
MARKTKEEALKTRQMLLDAAIEQFALRGVSNTTLTDIADAAGVTRGAVYWHFSSKSELFNAMWQEQLPLRDLIHHKLKQIECGNPLLDLRNKFVLGLQYIAETPRQRALMQILYHKCEFNSDMMSEYEIRKKIGFGYDTVRDILQGCVRNQILPKDTNIEIILIVLYSAFSGLIKNWLMAPQQFDLYQQAPLLVDNLMSAVCAQSLWSARPALVVNQ